MDNRLLLPIQFAMITVAWYAVALVYVRPALQRIPRRLALRCIVAPQMFRAIGVTMLAHGVTGAGLDRSFAIWVAAGDAVTAVLALAAVLTLGRERRLGTWLAAATTVVGLADLLHNLVLGARTSSAEHMGAAWLIVALVVPMMLVAHILAGEQLMRRATA